MTWVPSARQQTPCDVCGEPLGNAALAEVVVTHEFKGMPVEVGECMIVHADTCYSPETMELA